MGTSAGYERIIDALEVFLGINTTQLPTGNNQRDALYLAIYDVQNQIFDPQGNLKPDYQGLTITDISTFTKDNLVTLSQDPDRGLAFRYALQNLNPFVIEGLSAAADAELYAAHNEDQQLDRYDAATGLGMTDAYLRDRANMLYWKNFYGKLNVTGPGPQPERTYKDVASGLELGAAGFSEGQPDGLIVFGSERSEGRPELDGSNRDDHIFGGGGIDTIFGLDGDDYIEGNRDNDVLVGGTGKDTLLGGEGIDTLRHNDANSSADDESKDTLKGGPGNDSYYLGHLDTIEDSDPVNQTGLIDFNGVDVRGMYEALTPGAVYRNETNGQTLTIIGRDATIERVVDERTTFFTIKNFLDENGQRADGEYGITLNIPTPSEPTQIYTNPAGATDFTIRENNLVDGSTVISGPYEKAVGNDDAVFLGATGALGNLIYHEIIDVERSPGFKVEGGAGNDWIRVDMNYTPFIAGQTYTPAAGGPGGYGSGVTVDGQGGDDIIYGGLDDDRLFGGEGDDQLATWDGSDIHNGGEGNDTLGSNDYFYGKNQTQGANYDVTADDFYFGGAGKDFITDDWGNDTALGDEGSDFIATGSGADTVLGGDNTFTVYSYRAQM